MDNYLSATSSAYEPDYSENCKGEQKIPNKITTRQDALSIGTLVLLLFLLIAVTPPNSATSASCGGECCNSCSVQGDTQKCCKSSCTCGTSDTGSGQVQPGLSQRHKDVKCFNACVKSGYRCNYCGDACSYGK